MLTTDGLNQIKHIVEDVEETNLEQKLRPVRSDIKKLKADQDLIIRSFDRDRTHTINRVDHIETVLHIPHTQL